MRSYIWEPRDALPAFDFEVLPAVRGIYYRDRGVLAVDPLHLAGILRNEGSLDYLPTLSALGAAQDALLEAERARASITVASAPRRYPG